MAVLLSIKSFVVSFNADKIECILIKTRELLDNRGMAHQFNPGGNYADFDLRESLVNWLNDSGSEDDLAQYLLEIDASEVISRAFNDLLVRMKLPSFSQNKVTNQVRRYQELKAVPKEQWIKTGGHCAGISYGHILGQIPIHLHIDNVNDKASQKIERFERLESVLYAIATWDGSLASLNDELELHMAFFIETINKLQTEQSDPCMAFEAIIGQQAFYQNLILPWVYNQQGFEYILEKLLIGTEQAIFIGADRHASCVSRLDNEYFIYRNPNHHYGSLYLTKSVLVEQICAGISVGHSNTHPGRMPLQLRLFSSDAKVLNQIKWIESLIVDAVASDSKLATLDKSVSHQLVINRVVANHRTALMLAAYAGEVTLVNYLISAGARVQDRDVYGYSAYNLALCRKYDNCAIPIAKAKLAISSQPDIDMALLLQQALYEHRDTVIKVLFALSEGTGLAVNTLSQKKGCQGRNLLHFALIEGYDDIALSILDRRELDINQVEKKYGMTALHLAIEFRYPAIVKKIIEQKSLKLAKSTLVVDESHPNGYSPMALMVEQLYDVDDIADPARAALLEIYLMLKAAGLGDEALNTAEQWALYFQWYFSQRDNYCDDIVNMINCGEFSLDPDDYYCCKLVNAIVNRENFSIFDGVDLNTLLQSYLGVDEEEHVNLEVIMPLLASPETCQRFDDDTMRSLLWYLIRADSDTAIELLLQAIPEYLDRVIQYELDDDDTIEGNLLQLATFFHAGRVIGYLSEKMSSEKQGCSTDVTVPAEKKLGKKNVVRQDSLLFQFFRPPPSTLLPKATLLSGVAVTLGVGFYLTDIATGVPSTAINMCTALLSGRLLLPSLQAFSL